MKKPIVIGSVILATLFVAPYAFAGPGDTVIQPCPTSSFGVLCSASLAGAFGGLITAAFVIAILIALAYLIYGGIRWILSQGDKTKVDSARQHIIASLIGLIVVFLSYFLLNIVTNLFFGQNIQGLTNIPKINLSGIPTCDITSNSVAIRGAANQTCVDQSDPTANPPTKYTTCVADNTDTGIGFGHCAP